MRLTALACFMTALAALPPTQATASSGYHVTATSTTLTQGASPTTWVDKLLSIVSPAPASGLPAYAWQPLNDKLGPLYNFLKKAPTLPLSPWRPSNHTNQHELSADTRSPHSPFVVPKDPAKSVNNGLPTALSIWASLVQRFLTFINKMLPKNDWLTMAIKLGRHVQALEGHKKHHSTPTGHEANAPIPSTGQHEAPAGPAMQPDHHTILPTWALAGLAALLVVESIGYYYQRRQAQAAAQPASTPTAYAQQDTTSAVEQAPAPAQDTATQLLTKARAPATAHPKAAPSWLQDKTRMAGALLVLTAVASSLAYLLHQGAAQGQQAVQDEAVA